MKIYNNNPDFGDAGPHEAESFEALADEMIENFREWAIDEWLENSDGTQSVTDTALAPIVARLQTEFIAGLNEVE